MVKLLNAVSAQSVSAVHQDSWDAFAHVVLESAKLANIKTPGLVVEIHNLSARLIGLGFLSLHVVVRES